MLLPRWPVRIVAECACIDYNLWIYGSAVEFAPNPSSDRPKRSSHVSQFRNSPAIQKILRVLGTGESLSGKEIRARTGSEVSREQRAKLTDADFLIVDSAGRTYIYSLTAGGMAFVRDELGGPDASSDRDPDRLSDKERIGLFALLSPSLQVSNSELKRTLGITISPAVRSSLRDQGLVVVFDHPIRLELTEKGWQMAEGELSRPGEAGDPPLLKLLHRQHSQILSALRARGLGLVDMYAEEYPEEPAHITALSEPVAPKTVGARVIDAYNDLVYEPGGWVGLARLRDHLADVNKAELDEVLTGLFRDDRIKLIAEVNQKTLTDRDLAAALHVVGDEKHLFSVG